MSLQNDKCCTTVFFDVEEAFNKVWHEGLLYKLTKNFSAKYLNTTRLNNI